MSTGALETTSLIPAAPQDIYDAWLDGDGHAAMTGADATGSAEVGAPFTAWGGYITGTNLHLERGARIVQSWRTSQFADSDIDSRLEVLLSAADGGTAIVLRHSDLPPDQVADYLQGWEDHYFAPMKAYFGDPDS